MTDPRVEGIVGKVERAQEQIKNLNAEVTAHITKGTGHSLVGYADRNKDIPVLYTKLDGPPTPIRFAILFGEIVHQLRSSLDHLVWQLVLLEGNVPSSRTEFPIFKERDEYVRSAPAKIKGVSLRASTLIENQQPYNLSWGPEPHPLWRIHDLDRIDKHRLLLEARTNATFGNEFVDIWLAEGDTPAPYPIPPPNPEMGMRSQPIMEIVLQYGGRTQPVIPELETLCDWTKRVIDRFAPEFKV